MFIKVTANRSPNQISYVPVTLGMIGHLALADKLLAKEEFSGVDLLNDKLKTAKDPGTEAGRDAKLNELNEEIGQEIVELLNFLQRQDGNEYDSESLFQLVETPDGLKFSIPLYDEFPNEVDRIPVFLSEEQIQDLIDAVVYAVKANDLQPLKESAEFLNLI